MNPFDPWNTNSSPRRRRSPAPRPEAVRRDAYGRPQAVRRDAYGRPLPREARYGAPQRRDRYGRPIPAVDPRSRHERPHPNHTTSPSAKPVTPEPKRSAMPHPSPPPPTPYQPHGRRSTQPPPVPAAEDSVDNASSPSDDALVALSHKVAALETDLENQQRRREEELAAAERRGRDAALAGVFEAMQSVESALSTTSDAATEAGLQQVLAGLDRSLRKLGLEPMGATGEVFDPSAHEAIAMDPSSDQPPGHISQVLRRGWREASGRVVAPAQVLVSQ